MIVANSELLPTWPRSIFLVLLMLTPSTLLAALPTTNTTVHAKAHAMENVVLNATAKVATYANALMNVPNVPIDDVPLPLGATLQMVSRNTIHNGAYLSLATFESSLSLEDITQFYRGVWPSPVDATVPEMVETRAAGWLMLSHYKNGYNTVIQLRLANPEKSTGFLSVMAVKATSKQPHRFIPDSLQLLSETQSTDAGIESVLSVYASRESLNTVSRQLVRNWQSQNWALLVTRKYAQSQVLFMSRGTQRMEIVVSRDNTEGVLVVVNEIDHRD